MVTRSLLCRQSYIKSWVSSRLNMYLQSIGFINPFHCQFLWTICDIFEQYFPDNGIMYFLLNNIGNNVKLFLKNVIQQMYTVCIKHCFITRSWCPCCHILINSLVCDKSYLNVLESIIYLTFLIWINYIPAFITIILSLFWKWVIQRLLINNNKSKLKTSIFLYYQSSCTRCYRRLYLISLVSDGARRAYIYAIKNW